MSNISDILQNQESNYSLVIGNTALARAMIETNTKVISSYPGSPMPEVGTALISVPKEDRNFYFEYSINEKVATEVAFGASINGNLSAVFFKSVGLNVAADSFVQLSMMEVIGGLVIILGDDPGANSSQNEQDNRHYAELSYIPVFEPSTPEETYLMYKEAVKLSKDKKMPVIIRMTTHVCHQKQKVNFSEYKPEKLEIIQNFSDKNGPYIPIAKKVFPLKRKALEKNISIKSYSENSPFNKILENKSDIGIITQGLTTLSALEALEHGNIKLDILKIGFYNPLPENKIIQFLQNHKTVKILEELDNILEKNIKVLAYENNIDVEIIGKKEIEDWIDEYKPYKVFKILKRDLPSLFKNDILPITEKTLSPRPPQLCPGCGHRSAFYTVAKSIPEDAITVGDIGCHSLATIPPYNMGQMLLCMGHSSGTAAGLSIKNKNRKVIAFLGDSTMYHAGLPGIVNAVFNNHNFTLIILENGTTAMTGHQPVPSNGENYTETSDKIPVKQVLEGLGVKKIYEADTYNQEKLSLIIKEATEDNMFSVVIAKHPCMLKLTKKLKKTSGYIKKNISINSNCNKNYECIEKFGCPSFIKNTDGSVSVNTELCIGDGSCIQTCPHNAINKPETSGGINE